ncbi:MAG TPA: exosortase A [Burkholderiales bacterium]|jgi:exosortase A|nr:exosortase A [Burkholderiales bacterium]
MKMEPVLGPEIALRRPSQGWSKPGPYAVALTIGAIFWLLACYGDTAQSIVAIWEHSETFAHGYLIVPISVWMIWSRRHELVDLELRPNFLALPVLAVVGFGWLLGYLAGAGVVQQYAMVLMIPLLVWTILGTKVVQMLAFPLFFLLFAVPFGEFLIPPMMDYTADFTIFALRLTGLPVYREGNFFMVPSGTWSVVEACSGVRYLIASLTLGCLYAYLTYRSLARRAVFIAFSVIVPIVANWLRAYMIVMIGHLSGMKYAVGVDHLIYGWIFFGVVMLILFWVGSFWREDIYPVAAANAKAITRRAEPSLGAIAAATIAAAMIVAVWPVAASRMTGADSKPQPVLRPPMQTGGWRPVAERLTDWTPHFLNPLSRVNQTYATDLTRVGLYIAYYRDQWQGAKLITSINTLVPSTDHRWGNIGEIGRNETFNDGKVSLIEAQLRGASKKLLVWRWYWVDGQYTANPYWAKLLQAKSQLSGHGDDGAVVIVYTEFEAEREPAASRLHDFVNAMLPAITTSLNNAR